MTNIIRLTSQRLFFIAASAILASAANANPEMDSQGRDISSGPIDTFSSDDAASTSKSEVITDSVGLIIRCSRQTPQACPPSTSTDTPLAVRDDR